MDGIIYHRARLECDLPQAFEMFTVGELVESWLALSADIEPRPGGKYELFWDLDNREENSTIGCKVTAIEEDRFLSFEWKGPTQFRHFMNEADPLSHVVVFFFPRVDDSPACTEVHLIHSGWRSSEEWEEARQWFDRAWRVGFGHLEHQVNRSEESGGE
jgi:uncharacterized protein YndB with AHSA1/START domain